MFQYHKHLFVHIGATSTYTDPLLEVSPLSLSENMKIIDRKKNRPDRVLLDRDEKYMKKIKYLLDRQNILHGTEKLYQNFIYFIPFGKTQIMTQSLDFLIL